MTCRLSCRKQRLSILVVMVYQRLPGVCVCVPPPLLDLFALPLHAGHDTHLPYSRHPRPAACNSILTYHTHASRALQPASRSLLTLLSPPAPSSLQLDTYLPYSRHPRPAACNSILTYHTHATCALQPATRYLQLTLVGPFAGSVIRRTLKGKGPPGAGAEKARLA